MIITETTNKGGRPRVLTPDEIASMIQDKKSMSYKLLAKKYGCSKATAWNYCKSAQSPIKGNNSKGGIATNVQEPIEDILFPRSTLFQGTQYYSPQGGRSRCHTEDFETV